MKKHDWFVSISAGLLLGVIAAVLGLPRFFIQPLPAHAAGDIDNILSLVLRSNTKWNTLQGEAEIVTFGSDEKAQTYTYISEFALSQPLKVNVGASQKMMDKDKPQKKWISDGERILFVDDENKTYSEGKIPDFAKDTSRLPQDLAKIKSDEVYHHPLDMLISDPVMEYIYPVWFAQGQPGATYELAGEENIAGRKMWIINYQTKTDSVRAWIDQATGIILRYAQESNGRKVVEVNFLWVDVDKSVDPNKFGTPNQYSEIPQQ
jgi:hypothetical protein